jgi:hypothetical protein
MLKTHSYLVASRVKKPRSGENFPGDLTLHQNGTGDAAGVADYGSVPFHATVQFDQNKLAPNSGNEF